MPNIRGQESPLSASQDVSSSPLNASPKLDRCDDSLLLPSRKRKRACIGDGILTEEPYYVQKHPALPSPPAQWLIPKLLLARSCLPLAWVDQLRHSEVHPGPTLFRAHIAFLEKSILEDQSTKPTVLIAQSTIDDRFYAIERAETGVYAPCRLSKVVTLQSLEQLQSETCRSGSPQTTQNLFRSGQPAGEWWRAAAIQNVVPGQEQQHSRTGIHKIRDRLCLQRSVPTVTPNSQSSGQNSTPLLVNSEKVLENMVDEASPEPEEILSMIKSQYLEALYASKTSLAYFAKGPLSRARAVFRFHDASAYRRSILTQFLRSSIVSLENMDAKYRDTIPTLIKDLPAGALSDGECASAIATVSKKGRKSKKTNIGKNGLYAGEDVNVTRWWLGRDMSSLSCESSAVRDNVIKTTVSEQRARETQLQIILILEALALEKPGTESIPDQNHIEADPGRDESQKGIKKPKKPQDLTTLLELLADRLSIWQSMNVDESNPSIKESRPAQHQGRSTTEAPPNDSLQQFCIHVVLPFFGARLPGITTLLCQKLGGPKQNSPTRPPLLKAVTSASVKPGTKLQRQQSQKPRRTLERVLTDERSASRRPTPSLLRSATDPVLPRLKHEESGTSLSSIPLNMVAMHKRYGQREVDLHAASQATEAKLKKKAKVEQELQNAITALKKPNPRIAVKELVEDAERRVAASRSRKSKHPTRNPFASGVQVMATPTKNRHNNKLGNVMRSARLNVVELAESDIDEVPPSSISRKSASAMKGKEPTAVARGSSRVCCDDIMPTVEQTPTRGSSKLLDRSVLSSKRSCPDNATTLSPVISIAKLGSAPDATGTPSTQPVDLRPTDIQGTPSKRRSSCCIEPHNQTHHQMITQETASTTLSVSQKQETSIYETLGWDDYVDELV